MKEKNKTLSFLFNKPKIIATILAIIDVILLFVLMWETTPIVKKAMEPPISYMPTNVSMVSEGIYAEAGILKETYLKVEDALSLVNLPKKYKIVIVKEIPETLLIKGNYLAEEGTKYITHGMSVYEAKELYIKDSNKQNITGITIHEIAHVYDRAMYKFSEKEEFKLLYKKYKDNYIMLTKTSTSSYITSKDTEFFAGIMSDYILKKEEFKEKYPDLAIYAEKCYKKMKQ